MNFRMAMLSGVSSPTSAFAASARATSSSQSSKSTKYPSSSTVTFLLAYCSSTGIKTPSPFHYHLRLSNINYKSQFHDGQGWLSFFKGRALDVVVNPAVPETQTPIEFNNISPISTATAVRRLQQRSRRCRISFLLD